MITLWCILLFLHGFVRRMRRHNHILMHEDATFGKYARDFGSAAWCYGFGFLWKLGVFAALFYTLVVSRGRLNDTFFMASYLNARSGGDGGAMVMSVGLSALAGAVLWLAKEKVYFAQLDNTCIPVGQARSVNMIPALLFHSGFWLYIFLNPALPFGYTLARLPWLLAGGIAQ